MPVSIIFHRQNGHAQLIRSDAPVSLINRHNPAIYGGQLATFSVETTGQSKIERLLIGGDDESKALN
ncbi:hypothetical protein OAE37_00140 [Pirellulaceae bacterium]|jgi:hypothetical protein|nr:hypothetical protein [Pirellulaceae bacterium]